MDKTVRIWDLRKLSNVHTIALENPVHSVSFDHSGNYLAVGDKKQVYVYSKKDWELLSTNSHKKEVTCLKFGKDAQFLASASLDRNLKFHSGTKK